ncbi:MAG: hypothetical protein AAGG01_09130 [Planctomycetota bacterium]
MSALENPPHPQLLFVKERLRRAEPGDLSKKFLLSYSPKTLLPNERNDPERSESCDDREQEKRGKPPPWFLQSGEHHKYGIQSTLGALRLDFTLREHALFTYFKNGEIAVDYADFRSVERNRSEELRI